MAPFSSLCCCMLTFMVFISALYPSFSYPICPPAYPEFGIPITLSDIDMMQFPENLEFLEAEYFLFGALGYGLDVVRPDLTMGGPPPIGGRKANLDPLTQKIIEEFAFQEIGHLRALRDVVGLIPRPLLNISAQNFATIMDEAFGYPLTPPFDPYRDGLHFMLASYVIPYVGLTGYVGTNPFLIGYRVKQLLAGLLGVESGQDAVIRTYLYERADKIVKPYECTVAEFTTKISALRDRLGKCGLKDEGIFVNPIIGAENRTSSNVLSADFYSISYPRSAREILRIVYGTSNEHVPGGFYPEGGNGRIARELLKEP